MGYGNSNVLESSDIHAYLNNTWINRYEAGIKPVVGKVKVRIEKAAAETARIRAEPMA